MRDLVVGTICGGSDATSGLTANPAMGVAFDLLVADAAWLRSLLLRLGLLTELKVQSWYLQLWQP